MSQLMTQKVRFYVDPAWRDARLRHIPILFPFWGNAFDPIRLPYQHALLERHGFDTLQYTVTESVNDSDVILLPYNYRTASIKRPDILQSAAALSASSGKPLLIDDLGDLEQSIPYPHAIILRYGGYRFLPDPRVIILPLYADDLLEVFQDGEFVPREKGDIPVIGFAGWASLSRSQRLRNAVRSAPDRLRSIFDTRYRARRKGVLWRAQVMRQLAASPLVRTNFLARPSYSGHQHTASSDMTLLRRQFVDTLLASDYGLDVRGDANASIRLFEILSLGRIPLIIDTERNFPFESEVDYDSFSLRVDFRDVRSMPRIVRDFHDHLSNDAFKSMQQRARDAYVGFFRVDSLTRHMVAAIRARLPQP